MSAAVISIVVVFLAAMLAWAIYGPEGMRAAAEEWRRLLKAARDLNAVLMEVAVQPWRRDKSAPRGEAEQ